MKNSDYDNLPIPFGCIFSLKELPGWLDKSLVIPPGRLGIIIEPSGKARTLPPGKHRVISVFDRLRGKGVGLIVGYISTEPFTAPIKANYILSGDGELIDASLLLQMNMADPIRFFSEQIVPRGEVANALIDLSSEETRQALAVAVRQYATADIIQGGLSSKLAWIVQEHLQGLFQSQGLELVSIDLISFWRSDERALVAEKIQALEERLQDVTLQQKMAEIENQVQLDDFVQQIAPDLKAHLGMATNFSSDRTQQADLSVKQTTPIGQRFANWMNAHSNTDQTRQWWVFEKLFPRAKTDVQAKQSLKVKRPSRSWWLGSAIWISFLIIIGVVTTWIFVSFANAKHAEAPWDFILIIWGIVIVTVLESLKQMYQKREQIEQDAARYKGYVYIDNLVRNNRQQADHLVREQISHELMHMRDILNDLRSRIYKSGDETTALQIRELEKKIELRNEEIQQIKFGQPIYLTDLKVSKRAWVQMLDYDENLILQANAISDQAQNIQSQFITQGMLKPGLLMIEAGLDDLMHRFANRSRVIEKLG